MWLSALLFAIGCTATHTPLSPIDRALPPVWQGDLEGLAEARASGRPVLLDFWAEWCLPCIDLDAAFFVRRDVAQALTALHYIPIRVDLTEESPRTQALAQRYGVDGLPAIVLSDPRAGAFLRIDPSQMIDRESLLCAIESFPQQGRDAFARCDPKLPTPGSSARQ